MHWSFVLFITIAFFQAAQASPTNALVSKSKAAAKVSEPKKAWGASLSYGGSTDLMEKKDRMYQHGLDLSLDYNLSSSLSVSGFTGLEYSSINTEIIREKNSSFLGDSGLSGSYALPVTESLKLKNSVTNTFPTSQTSKDEGYKSILAVSTALPLSFPRYDISVTNSLSYTYIFNTYEYSPSKGSANPQWTASYSLAPAYKVSKFISIGASLQLQSTRFLDGVNRFRSGNSVFASASWKQLSSKLAYSNNASTSNRGNASLNSFEILQINENQQMVSWGLACSF